MTTDTTSCYSCCTRESVTGKLTAAAAVCSRCGGGLHSKLVGAAAAAALVVLLFCATVVGCHTASGGWLLTANLLWAGELPAPINDHDGCSAWCAPAGDWPRSARWVPERGWHGGSDAELKHNNNQHYYRLTRQHACISFNQLSNNGFFARDVQKTEVWFRFSF